MTEEVLLNSGYKKYEVPVWKNCDRFYQKKIDDRRHFNVYYYENFDDKTGGIDYAFEYELYEEKENYAMTKYIYGVVYPYKIEEIEKILLKG